MQKNMNLLQAETDYVTSAVLWIIVLLLILEAAGTSIYMQQFSRLFQEFGSELPSFTKVVLMGERAIWVLPIMAWFVVVFSCKFNKPPIYFGLILFFLGVLWVPIVIYGLYLPVLDMSEAEF